MRALVLILCIVSTNLFAGSLKKHNKSKIESVTVFKDRAHITRITRVQVPKGAVTVVFKGLTPK